MDGGENTNRSPPGRRPTKKLKFKPKVPPQKPRKLTAEKPEQEQSVPVDEELIKILRTPRTAAKTSPKTKEERSKQSPPSPPSSAAVVSLSPPQSGGSKQNHSTTLQSPRAFPITANQGVLSNKEEEEYVDDDEDDDDSDDDNVEFQENLQSSIECEASTHPAEELGLLQDKEQKERMFLFQLPKTLPLPRSSIVERKGKATSREVKEGSNLQQLPQGYFGKMLVYKSGKVKMKIGDAMFDVSVQLYYTFPLLISSSRICMIPEVLPPQVNPGADSRMVQHAVAVNCKEKHCCLLGEIENRHVIVTPDVDSLLNGN